MDSEDPYIENMIIGSLHVGKPGQIALMNCEILNNANYFIGPMA